MKSFLLCFCLFSTALATTYYGVDFAQYATEYQMECLAQNHYSSAFVRAYSPQGNGNYDANAAADVKNAYPHIGTEVFMTPQPMSTKPGYVQFDEMYTGLKNGGVKLINAFVQVVSPSHWSNDTSTNIDFIKSILSRMTIYGVRPGVYTSMDDWTNITGNWTDAGKDVMLWYYHAPSSATFTDFVPFGGWNFPDVKQFQQGVSLCDLTVNLDIFISPAPEFAARQASLKTSDGNAKPEEYKVGQWGL